MAHRERRSERSYERFIAEKYSIIAELQKGVDGATKILSIINKPRPIAAPPDNDGIVGRWRLYSPRYLGNENYDHRLWLQRNFPGKPVYNDNGNSVEGILFEIMIWYCANKDFQCKGILPLSIDIPNYTTQESFLILLEEAVRALSAVINSKVLLRLCRSSQDD